MKAYKGELVDQVTDLAVGTIVQIPATQVDYWANAEPEMVGVVSARHAIIPYEDEGFAESHLSWFPQAKYRPVRRLTGTMAKKVDGLFHAYYRKNAGVLTPVTMPSLGFDPEFFVEDGKGVLIPAWELFPSKREKERVTLFPNGDHGLLVEYYWDGYQAEFSFPGTDNYNCAELQMWRMAEAIRLFDEHIKSKRPDARISRRSTFRVPLEQLSREEREHVEFGCEPSLNAYGLKRIWVDGAGVELRPAGGHMHFGHSKLRGLSTQAMNDIVKMVDALGGVASVGLFDKRDDPERRKLYGRAGEYRRTGYGFEYRVYSNQWLMHPSAAYMLIDITRWAIDMAVHGFAKHYYATELEVQEAINSGDAKIAREIIQRNEDIFRSFGHRTWGEARTAKALHAIYNGIGTKFDGDVAKLWRDGHIKQWRNMNM